MLTSASPNVCVCLFNTRYFPYPIAKQSNTLISRILAMVAEDRSVRVILDELLGATVSNGPQELPLEFTRT